MYVLIPVLVLTFTWCSPFKPILWASPIQSHNYQHDITNYLMCAIQQPQAGRLYC